MKIFRFEPTVGLRLERRDIPHEIVQVQDGTLLLLNLRTRQKISLSIGELATDLMRGEAKLPGAVRKSRAADTQESKNPSYVDFASLPEAARERIKWRIRYVQSVADLYPIGPKAPIFAHAISQVAQVFKDKDPPSVHTVYRWLRRYVAAGYDVNAFARDAGVIRKRTSRLPKGVTERLAANLMAALANPGATLRGVYNQVLEATARELGFDGFRKASGDIAYVPRGHPQREANKKRAQTNSSTR